MHSVCEVGGEHRIFMKRDATQDSLAAFGIRGFEMNFKPKHCPYVGVLPIKLSNSAAFTALLIIMAAL